MSSGDNWRSEKSAGRAGVLVLELLRELTDKEIDWVYLRNYEGLPREVGNDVDLLVPQGRRRTVADLLRVKAADVGWQEFSRVEFGPLAQVFFHSESGEVVHLDLFDRLDWHGVAIADARSVLASRRWNGTVFIPSGEDETYLNVVTRLIYQGTIRPAHRARARAGSDGGEDWLAAFGRHLGQRGRRLAGALAEADWTASPSLARQARRAAWFENGLGAPLRTAAGILAYLRRSVGKILRPPGRLLVFEGADGVGKSTIIDRIEPWTKRWCGRDACRFHWKPLVLTRQASPSQPVDPRARAPRPPALSLAYLLWHLCGFWWGYLLRVFPRLVMNQTIIGDRYSYDLYLDPRRFRLQLPDRVCRWAATMTPRPDVVIGLTADPKVVHQRKPELAVAEIESYQNRWRGLVAGLPQAVTVEADASPEEVAERVRVHILRILAGGGAA